MIDVTGQILQHYGAEDFEKFLTEQREGFTPSSHPQAVIMLARLAAYHANTIEKVQTNHPDFEHPVNFQALANCLSLYVDGRVQPSTEEPTRPDEVVKKIFYRQVKEELNKHQRACVIHGIRRCYWDTERDTFYLKLTKRRRISALHMINDQAQFEALRSLTDRLLNFQGPSSDDIDDIYVAYGSDLEHLRYLFEASPKMWSAFENEIGFAYSDIVGYACFIVFLDHAATMVGHSLWYDQSKLLVLLEIFGKMFPNIKLSNEILPLLMKAFSLRPQEAAEYFLPVPFFDYGNKYLRYPNYSKTMSPAMGLLTIAIRKHETSWSKTVGSSLARAADVVASLLPKFDNILIAVRRIIRGVGDIDLALYDKVTQHLLICELKTVYDKHRTVRQMQRFEDSKVNLDHAIDQLRSSTSAIKSGTMSMDAIFGKPVPIPSRIDVALLTWIDPIDLTVGSANEDVFSLNFETFCYLIRRSSGDLATMLRAITELRNIWCVAERRQIDLQIGPLTELEVQVPLLDTLSELNRLDLVSLTQDVLRLLPVLPEGWRDDPNAAGKYVSYFDNTLEAFQNRK